MKTILFAVMLTAVGVSIAHAQDSTQVLIDGMRDAASESFEKGLAACDGLTGAAQKGCWGNVARQYDLNSSMIFLLEKLSKK